MHARATLLVLLLVLLSACGAEMPGEGDANGADAVTDDDSPDATDADASPVEDAALDGTHEGDAPDAGPAPDASADAADADARVDAGPDATVTFAAPPAPAGDVRQGDRGIAVGYLQFQLKLATGRRLDEDGSFGPATLALLNTFQTMAGLRTGTVADGDTRAALDDAATRAARALVLDYGVLPERFEVPPMAQLAMNLSSVRVVSGEGDKTAVYMGRTGFAYGDGAESTGITQGSPGHIGWVNSADLSASATRVIGTISRNEGPFDAVNSYDAGYYTWGAYQLIGAYRTSAYRPEEDELSNGLAYVKELDRAAFWHAFQRYGLDVTYALDTSERVVASSVRVTLARPDGSVLRGLDVWAAVGTEPLLNQVFINAGRDPRVQRAHILSAVATHFDVLDLPLATGRPAAARYFTSERAAACFLDMELNIGRSTTQRTFASGVDSAAAARGVSPSMPDAWPDSMRAMIEADVLAYVLDHAPSTRYATRFRRVLSSYFLSDEARSFVR